MAANAPGTSPTPALSHSVTRRGVRRRLLGGAALLSAGILLVVAFGMAAGYVATANQRIVERGAKVSGVVTAVYKNRKHDYGSIDVSYAAGDRPLVGRVDVQSDLRRFTVGQRVDVYYDRATPTRMTITGIDNQPRWSGWLIAAFLVIGAFLIIAASVYLVSWSRSRGVLARSPWYEVHGQMSMTTDNRLMARIDGLGIFRSPSISVRLQGLPPKEGVWTTTDTVWIAGPVGRRAVLAMPGGGSLLRLQRRG
jgi:hypothetical protein